MDDRFEQAKAHFFAALGRQQAGAFAEAERLYRQSLECVPGRASTLINLAAVQLRLNRPGDALQSADGALAAERDSVDALLHRATALAQLGRPHDALATFRRLLVIEPRHAAAWSGCGTVLREAGELVAAAHAFREALRHGGEDTDEPLDAFYLASVEAGATAPTAPPRAYVAGLFDGYADDFESHVVGQLHYQAHRRLVERLLAAAGASTRFESALDLGCGTGLCGPIVRPLTARLTGVDLSSRMLNRARALAVYDRLVHADIVEFLAANEERFDLVVAADVFIYVGDLTRVFALLERAMTHGVFGFTVEALDDDSADLRLLPSLRYAHSRASLVRLAAQHGLEVAVLERAPVREEQGEPVHGLYVVLRRAARPPH
ncbi:MAG TPA: methyltransferase domain-containing protein [Caldimonas sp.]|nr:methyltransferase domain-containing protein [Caldimonas sp.]